MPASRLKNIETHGYSVMVHNNKQNMQNDIDEESRAANFVWARMIKLFKQ